MRVFLMVAVLVGCRADVQIREGVFDCTTVSDCPDGFVCDEGLCWLSASDASTDGARDVGEDAMRDGGRDGARDASEDARDGDIDVGPADGGPEDTGMEVGPDAPDASGVDAGCMASGCGPSDYCDAAGDCVECLGDGHCVLPLSCSPAGSCVECHDIRPCPTRDHSRCEGGVCVECRNSDDCDYFGAGTTCNVEDGRCESS